MLLVQQPIHPSSPSLMSPFKQLSSQSHRRASHAQTSSGVRQNMKMHTPGLIPISVLAIPKQPTQQQHRPPLNPSTTRQGTPKQPRSAKSHPQAPQGERQHHHRERSVPAKDGPARNSSKPRADGRGNRQRQASPAPPSTAQPEQVAAVERPLLGPTPATSAPAVVSTGTAVGHLNPPAGRISRRRKRTSLPSSTSAPDVFATGAAAKESKESKKPKESKARKGSRPVPVSKSERKRDAFPTSQSVPILPLSHIHAHRNNKDRFPICDDNDKEDLDLDRPPTPSPNGPNTQQALTLQIKSYFDSDESELDERGPLTAPLTSNTNFAENHFPTFAPPRSETTLGRFDHKRTPSAPVDMFNFDLSVGEFNDSSDTSDNALPVHPHSSHCTPTGDSRRFASTPPRKPIPSFKYASSMFQCSPSPESLPKPRFSLASKKDVSV